MAIKMFGHPIYLGLAPPFRLTVVTLVLVIIGVLSKLLQYYVIGICSPIKLYNSKINCTKHNFSS